MLYLTSDLIDLDAQSTTLASELAKMSVGEIKLLLTMLDTHLQQAMVSLSTAPAWGTQPPPHAAPAGSTWILTSHLFLESLMAISVVVWLP